MGLHPLILNTDAVFTQLLLANKLGFQEDTPVNGVSATLAISSDTVDALSTDSTVVIGGETFTKVAGGPVAGEFTDANELADLIDNLPYFNAEENAGGVDITYAIRGVVGNNQPLEANILEDTTSGGNDGGTEATATIDAATIALIENGDTVEFDGETFTKVESGAGANEFTNQADLIALIHGLTDWTALDNSGDIDITAATDSSAFNDIDIIVNLYRATSGGVDSTEGEAFKVYMDNDYIYVSLGVSTTATNNWRRITLSSF